MSDSAPQWPALLSLAVHELRSPATVISGYVKMLLRGHGGTLTTAQREALLQAEQSCERVVDLLAEMSDLSRLNGGRAALASDRVDVAMLLSDAAAAVRPEPGLTFRLALMPPQAPCPVVVDRARRARAIAALAAMVARADEVDTVVATGERIGDRAVITVSSAPDRVTAGTLDRLGQFDDLAGGLGLSLPLARLVVESAGGQVHTLSAAGTSERCAAIVLPVAAPESLD